MTIALKCECGDCKTCKNRERSRRYRGREDYTPLRRLPIAPLLALDVPLREATDGQTHRWKARGWLSEVQADRVATRLGLHACEIWGDDWWRVSVDA